jgi:hypothetical protein
MIFGRAFFRGAAWCALLTVFTTLGVHLLPPLWAGADTFEKQVDLRRDPVYIGRLWMVLAHCALVAGSMLGVGVRRLRESPGLVIPGFFAYLLFAGAEMLRTSLVLFAVNGAWRAGYASAGDAAARQFFRGQILGFTGVNQALFMLFFLAFLVGNLLYGLALARGRGLERVVGWTLLAWAALAVPTLVEEAGAGGRVGPDLWWVGPIFQPLARMLMAVWLWRSAEPVSLCPEEESRPG